MTSINGIAPGAFGLHTEVSVLSLHTPEVPVPPAPSPPHSTPPTQPEPAAPTIDEPPLEQPPSPVHDPASPAPPMVA